MAKVTRPMLNRARRKAAKQMDRLFKAQTNGGCVNLTTGELGALARYVKEIDGLYAAADRAGNIDQSVFNSSPADVQQGILGAKLFSL